MNVAVILNGISLKKKFFYDKIVPALQKEFNVDVFETLTQHDAVFLASKAVDKDYSVILAAGGDGTVNQVLNGILKRRESSTDLPTLGVIPIGSGNDFARSIHATNSPSDLLQRLTLNKKQLADVGKIQYINKQGKSETSYFINVADAGMGPEVVRRVLDSDRVFGSAVAYYLAILATFSAYKPMTIHAKSDGWEWSGKLNSLAVGNGRYYGNGLCIAPDAIIDDGIFSTFICGDASKLEFIRYSSKLKLDKKINHPKVLYNQSRHLELTSDEPCMIEADGEWLGYLPATIDIIPKKINVL